MRNRFLFFYDIYSDLMKTSLIQGCAMSYIIQEIRGMEHNVLLQHRDMKR